MTDKKTLVPTIPGGTQFLSAAVAAAASPPMQSPVNRSSDKSKYFEGSQAPNQKSPSVAAPKTPKAPENLYKFKRYLHGRDFTPDSVFYHKNGKLYEHSKVSLISNIYRPNVSVRARARQ